MARPESIGTVEVTLPGTGAAADWSTGSYIYDAAGNITAMGGETYTYDKVSRLVSSARNGGESYVYDAFGNLIKMNNLPRTTDPATNRLTEASYDRRGNVVGWGGYTFTWDTMGRMTSMQGPGINRSMFYDANGERIVVRGGSTSTFTLRDLGQQVLREVSWSSAAGWQWGKDYIYRDGVLLASQSTSAGEGLRYHVPDHLTSPRLLTNRCGERGVEHRLSSFGVDVLAGSSQSADRMRLAMHERDLGQLSTTLDDLDYMHARYYNPDVARFLSTDPAGSDPRKPQTWNRYTYVLNNPVNMTDPDGRNPLPLVIANPSQFLAAASVLPTIFKDFEVNANFPTLKPSWVVGGRGKGVGIKGLQWFSVDLSQMKEGKFSVQLDVAGVGASATWTDTGTGIENTERFVQALGFNYDLKNWGQDNKFQLGIGALVGVTGTAPNLNEVLSTYFDLVLNYSPEELARMPLEMVVDAEDLAADGAPVR